MNFNKSVILGLTFAFMLLLALSFYYLYNSPTLGIALEWDPVTQHHRVASTKPWSRLKTGDTIEGIGGFNVDYLQLQMDNIYVKSRDELFSWLGAKKEIFRKLSRPEVTLRILRDGKEMEIVATPRKAGVSFLNNLVFLHFIAGIIVFLTGIIVFNRLGKEEDGLVFLAMSLSIMLVFITNATSLMGEIVYEPAYLTMMNVANIVVLPFGNAALFHYTLLLPRKKNFLRRFPVLVPLFYGICILIVITLQIPIINSLLATLAVLTASSVLYSFLAESRPIERQQMKWVLAGFLFGLGPWILINGIPLLVLGRRLANDTVPAAFFVFIPLFTLFAIWKYRLMDIDALFEETFAYAVIILLLSVADLGLLGLLNTHYGEAPTFSGILPPLLLSLSLYIVVRDKIRLLVRKMFKRTVIPEADVIASFSNRAKGLTPDDVIQSFADAVDEAFQSKSQMVVKRGDTGAGDISGRFHGRTGVVNLWERSEFSDLLSREFYVALVMAREPEPDAVLLLGDLPGRRFYSRRDLAVLKALLAQAMTLYENAILFDDNFKQRNARLLEEQRHAHEKEAILKDLHDGIGSISVNIHLLAEMAIGSSSPTDMKKVLSTIAELSQKGIFEIKNFLQSLDPEETTCEALMSELQHVGSSMLVPHGIRFHLERSGTPGDTRPGSLFFLTIMRIYTEALTNAIKHSMAGSVAVSASFTDGSFSLSVRDDGVGFSGGSGKGRGIHNMRERAKNIGGALSISFEKGTCVELRVPVSYPEPAVESRTESEMERRT
jgi:signal transduction histidine kinase